MKSIGTLSAAVAAAVTLTTNLSFAAVPKKDSMEKCWVVKDNVGLILAGKADCQSAGHSCSGHNKAGDPTSWILVPTGQCKKINAGDFKGINKNILNKIDIEALKK